MGGALRPDLAALAVIARDLPAPPPLVTMNASRASSGSPALVHRPRDQSKRAALWLWFGFSSGSEWKTKYPTAFFALPWFVALLMTPQRRFLLELLDLDRRPLFLLIFLPNLIWLVRHDFPFLELMQNIRGSGRDVVPLSVAFIGDQAMLMNPIFSNSARARRTRLAVLNRDGNRYRILGFTYALLLVAFMVLKGKNYYLSAPIRCSSPRARWI